MRFTVEHWLRATEAPWPDERGDWVLRLHWGVGAEGVECTGFELLLRPDAEVQPITATLLRRLKLQEAIRQQRAARFASEGGEVLDAYEEAVTRRARGAERHGDADLIVAVDSVRDELRAAARPWQPPRRPGAPVQLGREHYAAVARVYSEAALAKTAPLQAVITAYTVSKPTASRWVAKARELQLLPPTTPGRTTMNRDTTTASSEVQR